MRYRLKQAILTVLGVLLAIFTIAPSHGSIESTSVLIGFMAVKLVFLFLTMACFRAASDAGKKAHQHLDLD